MQTTRRSLLIAGAGAGAAFLLSQPAGADSEGPAYADVSGELPNLDFNMALASTGAPVDATHFAGHPVILYFGFTRCTDTCPLTMENAARLIRKMGGAGQQLRVLFVTIDPVYDTLPRLKTYMANFGEAPLFDALRGSNAQLGAAAKLYGVQYAAVQNADSPDPVAGISHSDAVYGFGPDGRARYILGTLAQTNPALGTVAGLMAPLTRV